MRRVLILATAAAAAVGLMAAPVVAQSSTDTSFTVTSNTAGLTLSQASSTADLGNVTYDFDAARTLSGTLPATTLTDERGQLSATWTVDVSSSAAFTSSGGDTVGLNNAHVFMDAADAASLESALGGALVGMSITGGEFNTGTNDLSTTYALLTGSTTDLGLGSAPSVTYTPAIDINVPGNTPLGTYSTTITQTAS